MDLKKYWKIHIIEWIVKNSLLPYFKEIKNTNQDLYSKDRFLEYFILVLFSSAHSLIFPSPSDKRSSIYFVHAPLICACALIFNLSSWINQNGEWGKTLAWREVPMEGGGQTFWGETPKDTMNDVLTKFSFLTLSKNLF